jgi:dTDP-4-dehydrorhamnose reductase
MRLCVTGVAGQLARALADCAKPGCAKSGGDLAVILAGRPDCNLTEKASMRRVIEAARPDIIVNAAAFTAVDKAETEAEAAHAVNAEGAGHVAAIARNLGLPLIHLSTDYVFDGLKTTPYLESDETNPQSVYGASKREGERRVLTEQPDAVILRTAWVFSHEGKNFLRTMLRLSETHETVRVVSDQFGSPTYAPDLAEACLAIAQRMVAGGVSGGVRHLTGSGDTSWAGFASAIFDFAQRHGRPAIAVTPIATVDYPTPAQRPRNSRLDCSLALTDFGVRLPHWADGTVRCLDRIFATAS